MWYYIRFSSFLLYRLCNRLRGFEEIEISSKAVEETVNNKEENSEFYKNGFSATLSSIFKDSTSGSLGLGKMQHSKSYETWLRSLCVKLLDNVGGSNPSPLDERR